MAKSKTERGLPHNKDLCTVAKERGFSHYCISLWIYLRGWMHSDNKKCYTSQERIADDLRCSVRVIKKAVKESKEGGLLLVERLPRKPNQQFDNNKYRFNFPWPSLQKPGARQTPGARGTTDPLNNNKTQYIEKEKKKKKKRPQKEGPFVVAKSSVNNLPPGAPQTPGQENELPDVTKMSEKELNDWLIENYPDPYSEKYQRAQQSREAALAIMEGRGVKGSKGLLKKHGIKKINNYLPFLDKEKARNPAGLFIEALNGDWVEKRIEARK